MARRSDVHEDPLFLACTRPAMTAGVTMEAMFLNMAITSIIFLAAGSLAFLSIGVVLHLVFRAICNIDHNQFRILFAFLQTRGTARTKAYWGATTFTPLRLRKPRKAKDLR